MAVQELRRVGTACADQAEMRQRHRAVELEEWVHAPIIISAHDSLHSGVSAGWRAVSMKHLRRLLIALALLAAGVAAAAAWWLNQPLPLAGESVPSLSLVCH